METEDCSFHTILPWRPVSSITTHHDYAGKGHVLIAAVGMPDAQIRV